MPPGMPRPTHHMHLEVVKLPAVKKGFVLLPKRWVIERDYEQLAETLQGLHFVAFAILLLKRFVELMV